MSMFDPNAAIPTARVGASARSGRRNAQRQRTMMGHPSGAGGPMAGAPEGQLFNTTGYGQPPTEPEEKKPGWGTPHGRPLYPGQEQHHEQLQLHPRYGGPQFGASGVSKYFNAGQFNKPAIHHAIANGLEAYGEARYFRTAGLTQALRHTFGMSQLPSHVNDYLVARHNRTTRGLDPPDAGLGD